MRDMIGGDPIQRLALRRGVPLRPTTEDIAAYEDWVARREGGVPEATSQAVPPLATAPFREDDVAWTPKPDKSKAAREADVTPWKAGCHVPSAPCEGLFDGPDFYIEEKKLEANAVAFAKYVKQLPRRQPVKKQMTSAWLPKLAKLGSRSPQQAFTQGADSQETQTLDLFH